MLSSPAASLPHVTRLRRVPGWVTDDAVGRAISVSSVSQWPKHYDIRAAHSSSRCSPSVARWLSWDSRPEPGCSSATAASSTAPEALARPADVRIDGDAIVEVGPSLTPRAGERVIDAAGRVVAPGFIDMHSHADGGLDESPDAATQLRQGITTALVGQDGGGDLPVADLADRSRGSSRPSTWRPASATARCGVL